MAKWKNVLGSTFSTVKQLLSLQETMLAVIRFTATTTEGKCRWKRELKEGVKQRDEM